MKCDHEEMASHHYATWPKHKRIENYFGLDREHIQRAEHSLHESWSPMDWYSHRGHNLTTVPLFTANISAVGKGGHRVAGSLVRTEELCIVLVVLILWIAAITLFINRWGKIRLMEPYQPQFDGVIEEQPVASNAAATAGPASSASNTARPSLCFPGDRRPSVMVQYIDEVNRSPRSLSNLSLHRISAHLMMEPKFSSEMPNRRASAVNLMTHQRQLNTLSVLQSFNQRRRSDYSYPGSTGCRSITPTFFNTLSSSSPHKIMPMSRRTSLQANIISCLQKSGSNGRSQACGSLVSLHDTKSPLMPLSFPQLQNDQRSGGGQSSKEGPKSLPKSSVAVMDTSFSLEEEQSEEKTTTTAMICPVPEETQPDVSSTKAPFTATKTSKPKLVTQSRFESDV